METWVVAEQDMTLIKSIIPDIIIVLQKPILEKHFNLIVWFVAFILPTKFKFLSVNERCEYVLKINTQYFELTMQKVTKYVGQKAVILNFQRCHM